MITLLLNWKEMSLKPRLEVGGAGWILVFYFWPQKLCWHFICSLSISYCRILQGRVIPSVCLTSGLTDGESLRLYLLLQTNSNTRTLKFVKQQISLKHSRGDAWVAENFPDILIWIIPQNNHPPLPFNWRFISVFNKLNGEKGKIHWISLSREIEIWVFQTSRWGGWGEHFWFFLRLSTALTFTPNWNLGFPNF